MKLPFVNRKKELNFLNEKYSSGSSELIIIYGRRRVGKTELIKNFVRDKPHIYMLCNKAGTAANVLRFKQEVAKFLHEPVIASENLEEIFFFASANGRIMWILKNYLMN